MTTYSYRQRPIGSCQAKRPARGSDTGMNVANAIALYERPKLVHTGPTPARQGEAEEFSTPWPWVRLDTGSDARTELEQATIWPQHPRGSLDFSLRLVGVTYAKNLGDEDPMERSTFAPVLVTAELLQYQNGSAVPVVLASTTLATTIRCFPGGGGGPVRYPLLYCLQQGWRASGGYNKDMQLPGYATQRYGQLYPQDLPLLQPLRLTLDYEADVWTPNFADAAENPAFVRVTCIKDPAREIRWDPSVVASASNPVRDFRQDEFIRIFTIGSSIIDRGRA